MGLECAFLCTLKHNLGAKEHSVSVILSVISISGLNYEDLYPFLKSDICFQLPSSFLG